MSVLKTPSAKYCVISTEDPVEIKEVMPKQMKAQPTQKLARNPIHFNYLEVKMMQKKTVSKRIALILAMTVLAAVALSGCGSTPAPAPAPAPAGSAPAQEIKPQESDFELPKTIAWTAYDVGGTGYIHSSAIANALKQKYGITMRVIPAGTDVARIAPLLQGTVDFCATGSGSWLAFEGLEEFSAVEWGPQNLRMVWNCVPDTGMAMATAADAGIETPADAAGKRVAYVVGNASTNLEMEAFLAFGGLTWDDCVVVEFPSYSASLEGLVNNTVDAAAATSDGAKLYELESSARGYHIAAFPANDTEGWARLQAVCPFLIPAEATAGPGGCTPETPVEISRFPTPNLITYADQSEEYVYQMCKMIDETFDLYKDAHASTPGWAVDRMARQWAIPFHDGAVRYLKEIGVWTDEDQAHNDELIARSEVLANAFSETIAASYESGIKAGDFKTFWVERRAEALTAAGMNG